MLLSLQIDQIHFLAFRMTIFAKLLNFPLSIWKWSDGTLLHSISKDLSPRRNTDNQQCQCTRLQEALHFKNKRNVMCRMIWLRSFAAFAVRATCVELQQEGSNT